MTWLEILLALALVAALVTAWSGRRRLRQEQARHARDLAAAREDRRADGRAQGERIAELFERMVEGVIVVGPDGRIRFANPAAGALFGSTLPAAGRTVLEATRRHEVAAIVARLDTEPEVLNQELCTDDLANPRFLRVNARALRLPDGTRDGALLVFHDLTQVRQLEGVRRDFVANVSHELRTPLSLIKSAAETLADGGKNDPATTTRFLEIIEKHANRLTLLIDDLLLLARLDSGRLELSLRPLNLRSAAQDALDDAALIARGRGVTLVNAVPAGVVASADPEGLRQVLANLIDNAIKYGRAEGVVTVGGQAAGTTRVELSVADDGPGIPAEERSRVFERFYRADKARSRERGGTGLGLAIVKNVVHAHGGDVRIESTPGRGATFVITLPAARE